MDAATRAALAVAPDDVAALPPESDWHCPPLAGG